MNDYMQYLAELIPEKDPVRICLKRYQQKISSDDFRRIKFMGFVI